jgi:hypothetical protein
MPGILKWLTAMSLVPTIFLLGSLIPNGSINVDGKPMANSDWWSCGAGVVVALLAIMMTAAEILLIQRSKYARPVFLIAMALTATSGLPLRKLIYPNLTRPLWPEIVNLASIALLLAWYLYGNKAVQKFFSQPGQMGFKN